MSHKVSDIVAQPSRATEIRTVTSRSANDRARGRKYLTRDEVLKLAREARKNRYGARDSLMILMAYQHALRVSELVDLKWQQIDLDGSHQISIQRAKGSLDGTHPLQGDTVRALKRYQRECGRSHGYVFINERGGTVSIDGFRKMFHRLSESVMGIKWNPHALRHASGVHLINQGADLRTVQQYMGHANIQNTVAYTALTGRQFEKLTF
ncbi:tyrosine-type recombinase/integrase [Cobetia sp. 1CM21F]|uniref:tyrosine-type recombinase/integrase n=1 Tax=Cobetia sp. 1CM21F TaxID=2929163 RepID=UPI0020BD8368|nr:tyrosine-type recombinase/integrase [Cobetia sp. 1CM21F]MCK8069795.1 tyrosine-type recombinase/integrase [Cobetia sp. 1CM21F]